MDPAGSERSRSCQAMADVLQKPSEAIAAMDFFTVPTLTFGVLYCFFVIGHDRRKNLLLDRDAKFGAEVLSALRDMGRANSHGLSQSVAERCCGALGGKLPARLAGPRDHPE